MVQRAFFSGLLGVGLFPAVILAAPAAADRPTTFEEVCFDDFDDTKDYPQASELRALLAPVPNVQGRISETTRSMLGKNRRVSQIAGLHRLALVWQPESVLRVSLMEPRQVQLHFWNGRNGITLRHYPEFYQTWAAYGTTRSAEKPQPEGLALWATDADRYGRTGAGTFEIRFQAGNLVMTRGNVVLLSVPFQGLPGEVFLEGDAKVRGLAFVSSGPATLPPVTQRPLVMRTDKPGELKWTTQLKEKVAFRALPDGRAEITAEENAAEGQATAAIGPPGLYEVICRIEDPQPGAGVFLGNEQGQQIARFAFFRDPSTGRTTFGTLPAWSNEVDRGSDPNREPVRCAGSHCWVRLVLGAGVFQCWTSGDGVHWHWPAGPAIQCNGSWTRFGVYVLPGARKRSLKLRALELRRFQALPALAPEAVRQRVPDWPAIDKLENWEKRVRESLPSDTPLDAWRRACAIRAFEGRQSYDLCRQILTRLLQEQMERPGALQEKLQLLDEAAMLHETADWNNGWKPREICNRLGRALAAQDHPAPFSTVHPLLLAVPCWDFHPTGMWLEQLLRHEIVVLAAEGRWQALAELCRRLQYWERPLRLEGREPRWGPETEHVIGWAEGQLAQRAIKPGVGKPVAVGIQGRHPLIESLNRESYNVLAEFRAALSSGSYRDACQIVSAIADPDMPGVSPDADDSRLSLSLRIAVELAAQRDPALRKAMEEHLGAVGRLRIKKAIAGDDAVAVEAASLQFCGTEAAAEAYGWLGDRALAGAQFAQAAAHYRQALRTAAEARRPEINARLRLTAALVGEEIGAAIAEPVEFSGVRLAAADFEKLIHELRQNRSPQIPGGAAASTPRCPVPGAYEPRAWAAVEGRRSQRPNWLPDRGLDWGARLTTAVADDRQIIVSNQYEISAFEMPGGRRLWGSQPVKEQEQRWPTVALRPLVTATRVFARRIIEERPELVCIDRADGKVLWDARPADYVASDPLVVGRDVLVLIISGGQSGRLLLSLAAFDARCGQLRRQTPLAEFYDSWEGKLPCAALLAEDKLVAVLAGAVVCCDLAGRVQWMRRQIWIPPPGNDYYRAKSWLQQRQETPLVAGDRLFVTQPGLLHVECLDLHTGRLLWRRAIPGLVAQSGFLQQRLIAETSTGLTALDAASGKILWQREIEGLLEGRLCGSPGNILCLRREQNEDMERPCRPVLTWLDPATGQVAHEALLPMPPQKDVRVGPLVAFGNRQWAFVQTSDKWASREIFELIPSEEKK